MKQSSHKNLYLDNEKWCKKDGCFILHCLYIDSIRKRPAQRERSRTTGMLRSSSSEDYPTGTYGQRRFNRKSIRRKLVQINKCMLLCLLLLLFIALSTKIGETSSRSKVN